MLHNRWHHLKRQRLVLLRGGIVSALILVGLLAPLLAPGDLLVQNLYQRLQPFFLTHTLGSDDFGCDILSWIIYGARIFLRIGLLSISIALSFATLLGLWAGYRGGLSKAVIMRLVDILLASPCILLAIAVVAIAEPGINNVMIALSSIVMVPQYARLVRASVFSIWEMAYIETAPSLGAGDGHILWRSVLPNRLAPLVLQPAPRSSHRHPRCCRPQLSWAGSPASGP